MNVDRNSEVLIVGAGLAGLTCARHLQRAGVGCRIFERADAVGGRVRTDRLDGFQLDRGFQVYLTAYPAGRRELDYEDLQLREFTDGSLVRKNGRFHRLADPLRQPTAALATLAAPVGSFRDKLRVLRLRRHVMATTVDGIFRRPAMSTESALRERWGFSESMIDTFFRPFIGGVTLDRTLDTSSRSFEFVMRMFSEGHAAVPSAGMQAIPEQLAASLDGDMIELNTAVAGVGPGPRVTLSDGREIEGRAIVVATGQREAAGLVRQLPAGVTNGVTCLYFAAEQAPPGEATLVLNSEPGLINNLVVMSAVAPSYAPAGAELISVTVLELPEANGSLVADVQEELTDWFGPEVSSWRHLRSYRIPDALPRQTAAVLDPVRRPVTLGNGLYVCGDHRDHASINGALESGQRTAEAILSNSNES